MMELKGIHARALVLTYSAGKILGIYSKLWQQVGDIHGDGTRPGEI
jgi:hypothetical protein